MISKEDYNFILTLEKLTGKSRAEFINDSRTQCAKTFLNLLGHVSKDQTVQYLLVIMDDLFKVISFPPSFSTCFSMENVADSRRISPVWISSKSMHPKGRSLCGARS